MNTDKNKVLNKFLAKESIKALYRLIEEIDGEVERLEQINIEFEGVREQLRKNTAFENADQFWYENVIAIAKSLHDHLSNSTKTLKDSSDIAYQSVQAESRKLREN